MQSLPPVPALEAILNDMGNPHEGKPMGVPDYYSWVSGPTIRMGNNPGKFTAITAWGQIYTDASNNLPKNTRVQVRNIKTYILGKQSGIWQEVQSSVGVEGAAYREDYVNNINKSANVRNEIDGSLSVKLTPGYAYHFWPLGGRATINPKDIGGVFTTVEARLVIDNPNQPDDRDQARLMLSMGGDYWQDTTAPWNYFKTNGEIAGGRFRYIDSQWDSFHMTTLTRDEFYLNPPPIALNTALSAKLVDGQTLAPPDQPIGEIFDHAGFRYEAEQATNIINYRIETIAAASNNKALSFLGGQNNESGSATFGFNEAPGVYDIIIGTFDENDGLASFTVSLNDHETGQITTLGSRLLNEDLGSNMASTQTKISVPIANSIFLTPGDSITVTGFENSLEHARLDFLELVPVI